MELCGECGVCMSALCVWEQCYYFLCVWLSSSRNIQLGIVLTIWCCLHSVHVNEATVFNSSHAQWQSESTPGFIDQVVLKSPGDFNRFSFCSWDVSSVLGYLGTNFRVAATDLVYAEQ